MSKIITNLEKRKKENNNKRPKHLLQHFIFWENKHMETKNLRPITWELQDPTSV